MLIADSNYASEPRKLGPKIDSPKNGVSEFDKKLQEQEQMLVEAKSRGFEQGYAEGLEKSRALGFQEGQSAARKEFQVLSEKIQAQIDVFLETLLKNSELPSDLIAKAAVSVVLDALGRVFGSSAFDAEAVKLLVSQTVQNLSTGSAIEVFVCKEDLTLLNQLGCRFDGRIAELKLDPSAKRGECKVIHSFGFIDAGIESQFENFQNSLKEYLASNASPNGAIANG